MKSSEDNPIAKIRLMGGLGNQLFQYALGVQLRREFAAVVSYDDRWLSSFETPRTNELLRIGVIGQHEILGSNDKLRTSPSVLRRASRLVEQLRSKLRPEKVVLESRVSKDDGIQPWVGEREYIGYWQQEKWFESSADEISRHLKSHLNRNFRDLSVEQAESTIALHVRLGDYISDKSASKIYEHVPVQHYLRGVGLLRQKLGDLNVVLYSDDVSHAEQLFHGQLKNYRLAQNGGDPARDLLCISSSPAVVMANSTFSWWGAWLAEKNGGLIVAPSRWYKQRSEDPCPKRWLRCS